MSRRNCWTCLHDRAPVDDWAGHTCRALSSLGVDEWIEEHVVPDSPGVPASMPPRDAPPCPGWAAAVRAAGAEAAATVNDSLTVAGGGR
jgi:hypothetical protein